MHEAYTFLGGSTPLLVSIPHDGREIPADIRARMTPAGIDIPDTDWHVAELYAFAATLGASVITARYSRYVVDLNRSEDDDSLYPGQVATGLCPSATFAGEQIYTGGQEVDEDEKQKRIDSYWRPYHAGIAATLDKLRERYGFALLWDAHSIPSRVPRLFNGELPVLNIGSFDGASCAEAISASICDVAASSDYEWVLNGRFKGGYTTRHYGRPADGIHALQLELAQRAYMDEETRLFDAAKAEKLQKTLAKMLRMFLAAASQH